jgi:hypothetical protein
VSYDPSGQYIATGALGGWLYLWSTRDGSLVKGFRELS